MLSRPLSPNHNKFYFFGLTMVLAAVLMYNLFSLQIVKGSSYFYNSKYTYPDLNTIHASRGLIYDRNGVKLVDNELKYNVFIHKDENITDFDQLLETSLSNLGKIFNEDVKLNYEKQLERFKNYKNISDIKLYSRIDYNPYVFQLKANPNNFPLVKVQETNVRKYLYPELFSHIIGYTGEIDAEDYATGNYDLGDEIGKFGIEKGYDTILRGQNGLERIDVNETENRRTVSTINEKINGSDIYLTLDINYQKKLYELTQQALKREDMKDAVSSATVVESVQTGEIMAMASYPTFDSNLFVNGISNQDYSKYINDPGKPLSNKATQYSQVSVIKIILNISTILVNHYRIRQPNIHNPLALFSNLLLMLLPYRKVL
jgi:penicillin-binding protein 2